MCPPATHRRAHRVRPYEEPHSLLSLEKDIAQLLDSPWHGAKRLYGLQGSSKAYVAALVARRTERPMLIFTPTAKEAESLSRDIAFFLDEGASSPVNRRIQLFPSWDILPFENLSPNPDHVAARLEGLYRLTQETAPILIATPAATLQRVLPRDSFQGSVAYFVQGEELDRDALVTRLVAWGFARTPLVEERGDFSVRGGIVDLFPPAYERPIRIELCDDRIESIREFDPRSQRSRAHHEELLLLPMKEFEMGPARAQAVVARIEARAEALDLNRQQKRSTVESIKEGITFAGMEFLVPYFHEDPLPSIFSYLSDKSVVWLDQPSRIEEEVEKFEKLVAQRQAKANEDGQLYPEPEALYLEEAAWREAVSSFRQIHSEALAILEPEERASSTFSLKSYVNSDMHGEQAAQHGLERSLTPVIEQLNRWQDHHIIFVAQRLTDAKRLKELLGYYDMDLPILETPLREVPPGPPYRKLIVIGGLTQGFRLPDEHLVVITFEELLGKKRRERRAKKPEAPSHFLTSLSELRQDDYVVHLDQGVGVYRGLVFLKVAGTEGEFLHLEYQGGDRMYLPVDRINLIQKFIGAEGSGPALDKLGGGSWQKVKARTRKSILAMAKELLQVYANREVSQGYSFPLPEQLYREFEAGFEYDETPDQVRAIEDTLRDMMQGKPMDRLICGDVGYGKTEVAMRAAFLAVMDGKQVAVLVPTTILAQQHVETFRARFEDYPVRVDVLNRFLTTKDAQQTLREAAAGLVDIVVGTHRLLQKDVHFKNLGLVIVDEEHRFGVAHKESLKKLRQTVDVMSLTATPIPRTLHMSLVGIRDLSVIETPPPNRLAVRTYVTRYDEGVIRDAILREINRDGQVFFLHNRVDSIHRIGQKIMDLVPEARIAVAHGQMQAHELRKTMQAFQENQAQVLVCSAIVESGLDFPNANTIIINRAERFGLAQLYQLRGRVGRSTRRAYAYLLIPPSGTLTRDAEKRLRALQELDELGSGFKLALHDLEIRGAGNLLGKQQSGQIAAVGFELYTQMMEETIRELKGEDGHIAIEPEIRLGIPAYFPDDYIPNTNQRLLLYKRLANLDGDGQLAEIKDEIRDRFGSFPPVVENLFLVMELRRVLIEVLVQQITYQNGQVSLLFHPTSPIQVERLLEHMAKQGSGMRLSPDGRLAFNTSSRDWAVVVQEVCEFLQVIR